MSYLIRKSKGGSLFDQAFDDFFRPTFWGTETGIMKTDITETDKSYCLEIELPGFKKDEIEVSVNDSYLTVSAQKKEKEQEEGNYLRRERAVSASRSYYVGDIEQDKIIAKYADGVLSLEIPKDEPKKPERKRIEIQ